jgi:hypothetical protein
MLVCRVHVYSSSVSFDINTYFDDKLICMTGTGLSGGSQVSHRFGVDTFSAKLVRRRLIESSPDLGLTGYQYLKERWLI